MTRFAFGVARFLSSDDETRAAVTLGADHGLVRVLEYKRAFALQSLVMSVPLTFSEPPASQNAR